MSKFYHITSEDRVESILKHGLLLNQKPNMGGNYYREVGIFLTHYPTWILRNHGRRYKRLKHFIFRVDVEGLDIVINALPFLTRPKKKVPWYEVECMENISPERLNLFFVLTEQEK
jgi:hypothetical protein